MSYWEKMALSFNFKNVSVHTIYLLVRLNQNFTVDVSDEAESLHSPLNFVECLLHTPSSWVGIKQTPLQQMTSRSTLCNTMYINVKTYMRK